MKADGGLWLAVVVAAFAAGTLLVLTAIFGLIALVAGVLS